MLGILRNNSTFRVQSNIDAVAFIIKSYRQGAESRGYAFELTDAAAAAMIRSACGYCGLLEPDHYNGIDRIDNAVGYIGNNCVPCCRWCNWAKGRRDVNDFVKWLRWVSRRAQK